MGANATVVRNPRKQEAESILLEWREDGLHVVDRDGAGQPVTARRCFPWSAPGTHVSLRDCNEAEVALVEDVAALPTASRRAVERALAESGFVMEITRIDSVEEEFEIRAWKVQTRQGSRRFQTRRDEWPQALPGGGHLIRDVAGDVYRVADMDTLDARSREVLWAFME